MNGISYEAMLNLQTITNYHGLKSQQLNCNHDKGVEEWVRVLRREKQRDCDLSIRTGPGPGVSINLDRLGCSVTMWAFP